MAADAVSDGLGQSPARMPLGGVISIAVELAP
jgi:hypothetical protein